MLILKRKSGEAIVIGGPAVVRVFGFTGGQFKIGIDAPAATEIFRGELATADQIRAAMSAKVPLHAIEDELDRRDEMKSEMVGANQWLRDEIDRLKNDHRVEVRMLENRILDLEDRLPDEEPRRPEDMGSRHGLEVSQRDNQKENQA